MAILYTTIVWVLAGPTDKWHKLQNTDTRTPDMCWVFYCEQDEGKGLASLNDTLALLSNAEVLEKCGLSELQA